ncbi:MAG: DUF1549 and DUF1553 domain-containing protein [Planctomycetes bacterium]|nr:DUF1549 and DUF1553 domain-containing protein [Planctomycetota bacterium]
MVTRSFLVVSGLLGVFGGVLGSGALTPGTLLAAPSEPAQMAAKVDSMIAARLEASEGGALLASVDDGTFLRRAQLKLTGELPTPEQLTLYALDPSPQKREAAVERFLNSKAYGLSWSRYWRNVILSRAVDPRAKRQAAVFDSWLSTKLNEDVGWHRIAHDIITATGDVSENGATALVVAQQADANNLASETVRVFLGIQIGCAQCHDHPYDEWKREQFHELAAFFPRVRIERQKNMVMRKSFQVVSFDRGAPGKKRRFAALTDDPSKFVAQFDRDGDAKVRLDELPPRLKRKAKRFLKVADRDNDGALTAGEIAAARFGKERQQTEHFMPNLEAPEKPGTLVHPKFFLPVPQAASAAVPQGASDLDRRRAFAQSITAQSNPWFARAVVNRVWSEMVGIGFVTPVDDLGSGRATQFPDVFDALAEGLSDNGYSIKWLLRTIAQTEAFRSRSSVLTPGDSSPHRCRMAPLASDHLLSSLAGAFGISLEALADARLLGRAKSRKGFGTALHALRAQFATVFGHDPSTPAEEIDGSVQQALWMMNSPLVALGTSAHGDTLLSRLLERLPNDEDVLGELYLRVLSRRPSETEMATCLRYVDQVGVRDDAFEDIFWSLVNSTEFFHHR